MGNSFQIGGSSLNVGSVDVWVKLSACYLMYICEPTAESHYLPVD